MGNIYRIIESATTPKTFTPQYSEDGGQFWKTIESATSITKEGAEKAIESFIHRSSLNEIVHTYQPERKPLLG